MSFLSVVVATYNREQVLRTTLERLAQQTLSKDLYEVIVVDDGSPDNTAGMVEEFIRQHPSVRVKFLTHQNRGPGYSENRGIREARGPWILLIADDIHPLPTMLESYYQAHQQNPQSNMAIAGKVIQSPELPKTVFLQHWDPFRYVALDHLKELSYLNFWACNVSFKKDFMLQHGMFLERLGAAHEDTELGWRLYKNGGMKLLYRQDALAHHYHIETIDSACKRAFERGLNFDVLADNVDDAGLYIRTHVLTRKTWPHFFRGGHRRAVGDILHEDRNPWWFIIREVIRRMLFNDLSVPVYRTMICRAENNRLLAKMMHRILIRGVVSYYFLRGLKELRRRRSSTSKQFKPLPI